MRLGTYKFVATLEVSFKSIFSRLPDLVGYASTWSVETKEEHLIQTYCENSSAG